MMANTEDIQRDYFKKFNEAFKDYQQSQTKENVVLVNRYLAFISSIFDAKYFDPKNVETCMFYINLFELIKQLNSQNGLLWSAIVALEQSIDNFSAKDIDDKYKFLPILTRLLPDMTDKYKILKVLSILQKFTYNIELTWNEVYLKNFTVALVQHFFRDDEEITHLSASVLINLCFKNPSATHCLLKETNIEKVLDQLKNHKVLRFKMQYIFKDTRKWKFNLEISVFIKNIAEEVEMALNKWNSNLMHHIVLFFSDIQKYHPDYLETYKNFDEFIDSLISLFEEKIEKEMSEKCEETLSSCTLLCLQCLFKLFVSVVSLTNSKAGLQERVLKFSMKWFHLKHVSSEAFKLIEILLNQGDETLIETCQDDFIAKLPKFSIMLDNPNFDVSTGTFVFKMLLYLTKTSEKISSQIPVDFFNSFVERIKKYSWKEVSCLAMTELELIMCGLNLLSQHSMTQLDELIQHENIPIVLSKALSSHRKDLILVALKLVKHKLFSIDQAALAMSTLNNSERTNSDNRDEQEKLTASCIFIENQIVQVLDKILNLQDDELLRETTMGDLIEIFEYKLSMCNSNELYLMGRIEEAATDLAFLSQQNALQNAQLLEVKHQNQMNMKTIENFEKEKMRIWNKRNETKTLIAHLKKEIERPNQKCQQLEAEIRAKETEIENLKMLESKSVEEQNLEYRSLQSKIDMLECKIIQLDSVNKQLDEEIHTKSSDIQEAATRIKCANDENQSLKREIERLKCEVNEKETVIMQYEMSMEEIETMRHRVIEIVQKKKNEKADEGSS